MVDDTLLIQPPLYLVGMKIYCWQCQSKMPVVAIVAPNVSGIEDDVCILSEIAELSGDVLEYVQNRVPTFKYRFSKTVRAKYYANTCPSCGVISGDFFLHSEPGAPFFPTDEDEASSLYLVEIPIKNKKIEVRSSFHVGTGELILKYAKRIK